MLQSKSSLVFFKIRNRLTKEGILSWLKEVSYVRR
jgi:hypothetical protein